MVQQDISAYGLCRPAVDVLQGALWREERADGWARPERFSENQLHALGSCLAWHPGLYRQMARCTSGVSLSFTTDSTAIALELWVEKLPQGTQAVLRQVPEGIHDSVAAEIDGRQAMLLPISLGSPEGTVQLPLGTPTCIHVDLTNPNDVKRELRLPGFGEIHHMRIWLPCLTSAAVRMLYGNGSFFSPAQPQGQLVVIGDSIAQGFVTGSPAKTWPAQLAKKCKLGLINQSVGGQVFQPETVEAPTTPEPVQLVIVALGGNYRFEKTDRDRVKREISRTLHEIRHAYGDARIVALTPTPHFEVTYQTHPLSCFEDVPGFIAEAAASERIDVIEGTNLLKADPKLFADDDHPNVRGAAHIAACLAENFKKSV